MRKMKTFSVLYLFGFCLEVINTESCQRYLRKEGVKIDLNICNFKNFTEPVPKWFCTTECDKDPKCHGVATSFNERVNFCCLLHSEEILYKPGGGMMLHYKRDETTIRECPAAMKLQRGCSECYKGIGWQEPDCNSCKPGWQAPDCEACRIGWHGNNCHVCKFGFDPRTGCTTCIQNGLWQGTVEISQDIWGYSVRLSFEGHDCSTLVPGTQVSLFPSSGGVFEFEIESGEWIASTKELYYTEKSLGGHPDASFNGTTYNDKRVTGFRRGSLPVAIRFID